MYQLLCNLGEMTLKITHQTYIKTRQTWQLIPKIHIRKGLMTANTPKHTITVSVAFFHWRRSFCTAITEAWASIWLWIEGVRVETDANSHRHERDVGLIENITEPTVQGDDLISISKRTETRDAAENGQHKGLFLNRISMSLYYVF